jgi:magnesium-transporting ATPase (P-type)
VPEAQARCVYGSSVVCGERSEALLHAQTASFISIILMQIGDLIVCRTRRGSVFTHGITGNPFVFFFFFFFFFFLVRIIFFSFKKYLWRSLIHTPTTNIHSAVLYGIASELFIGIFLVYVPFMNSAMGTRQIRFEHWIPGIPFAFLIVAYEEVRKWVTRSYFRERANLARYAAVGDSEDYSIDHDLSPPSLFKPRDFKRWVATYTPW